MATCELSVNVFPWEKSLRSIRRLLLGCSKPQLLLFFCGFLLAILKIFQHQLHGALVHKNYADTTCWGFRTAWVGIFSSSCEAWKTGKELNPSITLNFFRLQDKAALVLDMMYHVTSEWFLHGNCFLLFDAWMDLPVDTGAALPRWEINAQTQRH